MALPSAIFNRSAMRASISVLAAARSCTRVNSSAVSARPSASAAAIMSLTGLVSAVRFSRTRSNWERGWFMFLQGWKRDVGKRRGGCAWWPDLGSESISEFAV